MDAPARCWYFSTVGSPQPDAKTVRLVDFHRTKYGRELLVDAAFVSRLAGFETSGRPHLLRFHDILLVTRGSGSFTLDGQVHRVSPGALFFTRPGEVRRLRAPGLEGACLFFTEDFLAEAFLDARFLERLAYFRPDRPAGAIRLRATERRQFMARFRLMTREIAALRTDAPDALRAVLYEILVLLNRCYVERHGPPGPAPNALLERFLGLVERDFRKSHRVAEFAAALGVSPGHLNTLCRTLLRRSASAWIRRRRTLEAKRLLLYGDLTAAQVADRLGFEDPAYFARFFRREAGAAPTAYRNAARA